MTTREAVVKEALEWIGTPYVSNAEVKGKNGGIDCLTFIANVYHNVGLIPKLPIPHYSHDFHMHGWDEHYLNGKDDTPGMLAFCNEVIPPPERLPLPADIVLWRFGHVYSHGAIVIEWPIVIHAWYMRPVGRDDAERRTILQRVHESIPQRNQPRPRKFFELKEWGAT